MTIQEINKFLLNNLSKEDYLKYIGTLLLYGVLFTSMMFMLHNYFI